MHRYLARRTFQLIPVLFVATVAIFSMIHLVPGDPATLQAGLDDITPEYLEAARQRLGLDKSLPIQYLTWLTDATRGELGSSYYSDEPVVALILDRFPATLQLTIASMTIALLLVIPLGVIAGVKPRSRWSRFSSLYSSVTLALPGFWVAILFILVFGLSLSWIPTSSTYISVWSNPLPALQSLAGPSITLGLLVAGTLARFVRASLADVLGREYVQAARARGLTERKVVWKHALRNASLPVVTVIGIELGSFLAGAVVIEAVFNYPGIGRLMLGAVLGRDYPVVQGAVLFSVVIFTIVTLLVDLSYALLNPRIRLS